MDNTQFYEVLPDGRYRFRVDHHTINDFNTCDQYFEYRHMPDGEGKVYGAKRNSLKVTLGSWWSSVMELFYNEMTFGKLPPDVMLLKFATDAWKEHDVDAYKNVEADVYDTFGGIDGAKLMALEYYRAFGLAHFSQWQIVGAELGFGWRDEVFLGEDDKVVVYYGGKPDLTAIDRVQKHIFPLDFKTKDHIVGSQNQAYKPHPQTTGYIFAVNRMLESFPDLVARVGVKPATSCVIMVCARFRPSEKPRDGIRKPRFMPVYPNYTADEVDEWRRGVIEKCRRLRDAIERGVWIKRESACHLYHHGCMFRRVCASAPNARHLSLRADFAKIEPWAPYRPEED